MSKQPIMFEDWLNNPSFEATVCSNPFHNVCEKIINGYSPLDADAPDLETPDASLALLLKAQLVIPEGDAIYIKEGENLHLLGDAIDLLAYYMHVDSKIARKAADKLETNFQGYYPVKMDMVEKNHMIIIDDSGNRRYVNLKTLQTMSSVGIMRPVMEYGVSKTTGTEVQKALHKFFTIMNEAIGDPYFLERAIMYPFKLRIREKSTVLVGGGGNGKGTFMKMVQTLYGAKAMTDAVQPTFSGHSAQVIAYNFIGKKVVSFNDVNNPDEKFLEWLKGMITGNLQVKAPNGAYMSVPCDAYFMFESNHQPEILDLPAHKRRYVVREFPSDFALAEHMTDDELDLIGERGTYTAADIITYIMSVKEEINDWIKFD